MTEDRTPIIPIIMDEVPAKCDTCGAERINLNEIEQMIKNSFGMTKMTVGYYCESCENTHLYRK